MMDKLGKKLDHRMAGVIAGILLTLIGFVVFWQWRHGQRSLGELYHYMVSSPSKRSDLLIFSVIPNLLLFYLVNFQWRWDRFTTGLVAVTIVFTVFIAILILF